LLLLEFSQKYQLFNSHPLKDLFQQYLPFLKFLAKFLGTYIILTLLYNAYLKSFDESKFEPDNFTLIVANHSGQILEWVGFDIEYQLSPRDPSMMFLKDKKPFVRIVEGCNALSVMILFVAFIIAFSNGVWRTFRFLLIGVFIIHVLNVLRIALLTLGLYYYPEYKTLMHDIVFPLFIYGIVFGLWVLWVNKFSNYARKN